MKIVFSFSKTHDYLLKDNHIGNVVALIHKDRYTNILNHRVPYHWNESASEVLILMKKGLFFLAIDSSYIFQLKFSV